MMEHINENENTPAVSPSIRSYDSGISKSASMYQKNLLNNKSSVKRKANDFSSQITQEEDEIFSLEEEPLNSPSVLVTSRKPAENNIPKLPDLNKIKNSSNSVMPPSLLIPGTNRESNTTGTTNVTTMFKDSPPSSEIQKRLINEKNELPFASYNFKETTPEIESENLLEFTERKAAPVKNKKRLENYTEKKPKVVVPKNKNKKKKKKSRDNDTLELLAGEVSSDEEEDEEEIADSEDETESVASSSETNIFNSKKQRNKFLGKVLLRSKKKIIKYGTCLLTPFLLSKLILSAL